jgi:hypothetical protein
MAIVHGISWDLYRFRNSYGRSHESHRHLKFHDLHQHFVIFHSNVFFPEGGAPKIATLVYNSNNYDLWYL